jgi:tRNA-(ms[2]io[6]A)-hydroxylase
MASLNVPFERQKPGRYASALRALVRTVDPGRKLDLMLISALIEARSCERFRLLAPRLTGAMGDLYTQLEKSEARHFELYLNFARGYEDWQSRLRLLAEREAELATTPDTAFRFHSGVVAI